ncbi:MAG TPA: hypothetical protein PLZ57_03185 [Pseudobdellovibrionaceae bacterium]|nr:hypothetical protein [Pseudobdellovibrionaceae bacterium]
MSVTLTESMKNGTNFPQAAAMGSGRGGQARPPKKSRSRPVDRTGVTVQAEGDDCDAAPVGSAGWKSWELWACLLVAAIFRFFELGLKPPHFDEGINGHFVMQLWQAGRHDYDPTNFHGPLYFYLLHFAEVLGGRGVEVFRAMNAILAMLLVLSLRGLQREVGVAARWAGWALAVSPAFVFYGRYAIHETLFIIGQVFYWKGRMQWRQLAQVGVADAGPGPRWATLWMVFGAWIMICTKETFFIFMGTVLIAELMWAPMRKILRQAPQAMAPPPRAWSPELKSEIGGLLVLGLMAWAAMFTGFFTDWSGLGKFFEAFDVWSKTGQSGSGHEKAWWYWLAAMFDYEWPMLGGLLLSPFIVLAQSSSRHAENLRLSVLIGFGHYLAYTIIPYKTPWLIMNFWPLLLAWPPHFLNRVKFAKSPQIVMGVASLLILASAVWSARLNFAHFVDRRERYVYVQTSMDYRHMMNALEELLRRQPERRADAIVVAIKDPWPLPYELSLFPKMRYAFGVDIAEGRHKVDDALLILIDAKDAAAAEARIRQDGRNVRVLRFHIRDAYDPGVVIVDMSRWDSDLIDSWEEELRQRGAFETGREWWP